MATTHIFTVNAQTFNIHLNYMFAGIGKDGAEHQTGALADILGIREGDNVIFYVMEHGFYGFFNIEDDAKVFYEAPNEQYLDEELGNKTLTYRIKIKPSDDGVYKYGVKEWEGIENPGNIMEQSIFNMQWTWIFKKLGANRGCTAIPNEEYELLKQIIVNGNEKVAGFNTLGYNNGTIVVEDEEFEYAGVMTISPRKEDRLYTINTEEDLRILFTAKAGIEPILNQVILPEYGNIKHIANEIICSFGERRIDLMFVTDQNKCILIELKNNEDVTEKVVNQVLGYARWISKYKNFYAEIIPIIIVKDVRNYPTRGHGKYYKALNQENFNNNICTQYYVDYQNNINKIKRIGAIHGLEKVGAVKIYSFELVNNKLRSFREL